MRKSFSLRTPPEWGTTRPTFHTLRVTMHPVFLHGRGLVSALGSDLTSALECLRHGGVEPARLEVGPGITWPYFAIADADTFTHADAYTDTAV